jgi:alpha-1,2-mannosyltransferase
VPGRRPLVAGAAAFGVAIALYAVYAAIHPTQWTLNPVDLAVYRSGGLIVRHIRPVFDPRAHAPLYDWAGYGSLGLKFTYTPFAAIVFAVVSFIPWSVLPKLSMGVNIVALVAALWFTFGGLGYRNRPRVRLGATLLASAAVFWTEPVVRTLYLGQVNLVLMALILWDLCQPDTKASRWWKGAGVGIAAGIKLVPLVFIPYLLFARKFRQAAMASAAFVFTVLLGFVIQGPDSSKWWFGGLFFQGGRTGFTGWEGNQSLRGLLTRLAGSISGAQAGWILAAVLIGITGIACAAILDRAGHQVAGLLAAALTGLLLSPISWDHHWVWTAPAVAGAPPGSARGPGGPWPGPSWPCTAHGRAACGVSPRTWAHSRSASSGSRRTPTRPRTTSTGTSPGSSSTTGTAFSSSPATRSSSAAWPCSWSSSRLRSASPSGRGPGSRLARWTRTGTGARTRTGARRPALRASPPSPPGPRGPAWPERPTRAVPGPILLAPASRRGRYAPGGDTPSCREQGRSHAPRHTAVPCRSCREPAAARAPAAGARGVRGWPAARSGPAGGRGRRDRRGRADAGRRRPARGDRR